MWSVSSKIFSTRNLIIIALLAILAYLMPYFMLGEDTHIRVHDNLDSNIVWYKLLADSGMIFASPNTLLPQIINGIPRSDLPSGLDGLVWLYAIFKPFTAYTIMQTSMRFVAFFGMYLLLKKDIFKTDEARIISVSMALCYALLPFWPSGALSIAGLPLALHLFLTIRQSGWQTPLIYWFSVIVLAFFSNFIISFIFFLGIMGLVWLMDMLRSKQFNAPFFTAIAGMTTLYLIKNYMLVYTTFIKEDFVSHRSVMNLGHKNLADTWQLFLKNFIHGHTHVLDLHTKIILPAVLIGIIIAALYQHRFVKPLIGLLILNIFFSLVYALWYWEGSRFIKDNFMLFNTFNFGRLHFLRPLLWYLMFAMVLWILWQSLRVGKILAILLIFGQLFLLFPQMEEWKYRDLGTPTFKSFYATEQFEEIEDYIDRDLDSYRVVSIAMHPTIAQYNGFYTLDTYNNSYPLTYKRDFSQIILPELEKSQKLKTYFDNWGGRLYMYSSELGKHYVFQKDSSKKIESYDMNTTHFKAMGGEYVLSGLPIENHEEIGLNFEKTFENPDAAWKIYLYHAE